MVENGASLRYPWGGRKKDSGHDSVFPVTVKSKS